MLIDDLQRFDDDYQPMLECGEMTWLEHVPLAPERRLERHKMSDVYLERWLQSLRRDSGT